MEPAVAKGHSPTLAAKPLPRGVSGVASRAYEKCGLDAWLELLARELARLGEEERRDVDAVFAGLEPAFVDQGWSGAYWEADGPVAVLRQVIAPQHCGAEFAVPLAGLALGKTKIPAVFEVIEGHAARLVDRLTGPERGVPLFTTGAFVPVFEGDRVSAVLAVSGQGFGAEDLAVVYLIAHHLASVTAVLPREPISSPAAVFGRVSALIASEIRDPVRDLASLSGRLRERLSRDAALSPLAMDLERGSARLRLLLEDLLDYTRPLTPWKDIVPLDIVARSVIASVRRVYRDLCDGRTLTLEVDRPSPMARVDPALLSRALSNVIVSVVERAEAGSSVRVSVISRGREAKIEVVGEGYEPGRDGPVEAFDTLSPAVRRRHAIGLAAARRLTRSIDGRLVLRRGRSGGSYSFRFTAVEK